MAALKGKCLCGSVEVEATPEEERVAACHCNMCRKWAAGPFVSLGCGSDVKLTGEGLGIYRSSDWAERVFCNKCGTSIAWRLHDGGDYQLSANLFEETGDYPMKLQVFIDEKPANYSFAEQTKTMTGAEIFAMFGGGGNEQ